MGVCGGPAPRGPEDVGGPRDVGAMREHPRLDAQGLATAGDGGNVAVSPQGGWEGTPTPTHPPFPSTLDPPRRVHLARAHPAPTLCLCLAHAHPRPTPPAPCCAAARLG